MSLNLSGLSQDGEPLRPLGKIGHQVVFIDPEDKNGKQSFQTSVKSLSFTQIPNTFTRDMCYITGRSGSGKSTYTKDYLINYHKLNPESQVFIFSKVKDDPAFEELKFVEYYPVEDLSMLEQEQVSEVSKTFQDCCCVFDDIDQFPNTIKKNLTYLRDVFLEVGRHQNVYVLSTAHILTNYKQSRILLNESTSVTFFPASGFYVIGKFLKEYIGLSKEEIKKIKNTDSRWVTVFRTFPTTVMTKNSIYIPKNE